MSEPVTVGKERKDCERHKVFEWFDSGGTAKGWCEKNGYVSQSPSYIRTFAYFSSWKLKNKNLVKKVN